MKRGVQEIRLLLTFFLFSTFGISKLDALKKPRERHLFVQRRSPLPGSPTKLQTVERESVDNVGSSEEQDPHKILSRVRRSVNPDLSPRVKEVRLRMLIEVWCNLRAGELNLEYILLGVQYYTCVCTCDVFSKQICFRVANYVHQEAVCFAPELATASNILLFDQIIVGNFCCITFFHTTVIVFVRTCSL